ncbi:MAG TPA: precorrin-6A synthase (deacetylating) [Polyangiales bacterium]
MRELLVIGVGAGDPEYVTVQAIKALNRASVFFVADKGEDKASLVALRREICERYIERPAYRFVTLDDPVRDPAIQDYAERVRAWHAQRTELLEQAIARELPDNGCGAFLVWGDPSLYDSTLRIVAELKQRGRVQFELTVIPGISSVQALAARHQLILNRIGGAVQITTGRRLIEEGFPHEADDVLVMLDGDCAFRTLPQALQEQLEIYWGAYLGTPDELLAAGPVCEQSEPIQQRRAEAREREGWIMDTYLLRRTRPR